MVLIDEVFRSEEQDAPHAGAIASTATSGGFDGVVMIGDESRIPAKYRELIALAAAVAGDCTSCLDAREQSAATAGASPAEIAEVTWLATVVAGYSCEHPTALVPLRETLL